MKLYLDSNILLDYLLDSRGKFHDPAVSLMMRVAAGDCEAGFSTSQATDLYYCLRKAAGDDVARDALRKLFRLCELFETPAAACVRALDAPMRDYEDAVQAETARLAGCDFTVTRDAADYDYSPVPCADAAEIIARL